MGRVTGSCKGKGKGRPMRITHPASGAMLTTGIVGSSIPNANGLAWDFKLDGSQRVAIANFGDGASNIGAFHESLNLTSLWRLPVIFVCQNYRFAEHRDLTIVTYSEIVNRAMAAAVKLEKDGLSAEVIDLRTASSRDSEAVKAFGVGAEIAATVAEQALDALKAPVKRLGAPFAVPFGSLEKHYVVSVAQIVEGRSNAAFPLTGRCPNCRPVRTAVPKA